MIVEHRVIQTSVFLYALVRGREERRKGERERSKARYGGI